ncbi:4'-phosphopantetheinyl transferase family protein [Wenzhouxiangella sediminis]|uniref:4-phosphopantetheinyl transferase n=1 Tax=Wenzhouxiangella sediminis TaxID=1792836 RepID=A0A3E1K6T4_9GAMM|nr:4'-phosphopantetheinyl transferase superfamily protein [Wenzhouxiangella sediminis]RFF29722.1 4-phosphopantetheinyl transferase [Wenzhouxiangella sediminis]
MSIESVRLPIRSRSTPARGEADVWLARLSDMPLDAGPRGGNRRERILRQRVQQQFFLRLLLAAYLGCPGKSVELDRSERGKPMLSGVHADSALQFNVSHSGDWLAVAVAVGVAVGIDLEVERRLPRAPLLARRFLSPEEAEWIVGLDEPFRSRQFLKQWTARESLVKARGCGLAGCLGEIALDWQPPAIRRLPTDWEGAGAMSLANLALPDGLVGHLATCEGPVRPMIRRITT